MITKYSRSPKDWEANLIGVITLVECGLLIAMLYWFARICIWSITH